MKQNLYKFIKSKLKDGSLFHNIGLIVMENHYDPGDSVKHIVISWDDFKEFAKQIDFEYASSLDIFHNFYIINKEMDAIFEFGMFDDDKPCYNMSGKILIQNAIPFRVYFRQNPVKSYTRLLIKLIFKEYLKPDTINYRKDYFIWYKEGKRYLVFNLSNEVIRVKLGDGKETILQYDTRPKESNMLQENQYIEAFVRMLTKIAPKDMQIIAYIGVCPLSGDQEYVTNAIRDRKALAYKLSLRYENVTPVYDYREMEIK